MITCRTAEPCLVIRHDVSDLASTNALIFIHLTNALFGKDNAQTKRKNVQIQILDKQEMIQIFTLLFDRFDDHCPSPHHFPSSIAFHISRR